jgi:RNA polymerase sigma-70 factor, ECF subfamily
MMTVHETRDEHNVPSVNSVTQEDVDMSPVAAMPHQEVMQQQQRELMQHRESLVGVAYRMMGDRDLAQDIVQDVFLSVIESPTDFRGASSLKTYLYRIVINRCIDCKRRQKRFGKIAEILNREQHVYPRDTYEIKDTVRKLLAGIPPEFRIPFILSEVDGMSYEEIADVQNVPLNTIRTRIFRCREKLQKKLSTMGWQ